MEDKKAKCPNPNCNHRPKQKVKLQSSEKMKKGAEIAVINEKDMTNYPVTEVKCSKCKNNKVYFWTMQTRASDESETKFYKCTKCGHAWREYR